MIHIGQVLVLFLFLNGGLFLADNKRWIILSEPS